MTYSAVSPKQYSDTLVCYDSTQERLRRPTVEPLTPVLGSPILSPNDREDIIATSFGEGTFVTFVDAFAQAAIRLAEEMELACSRNNNEIDLDSVMGRTICCCNIMDSPGRIELHFVDGTGIIISLKDRRDDDTLPWEAHFDSQPTLDIEEELLIALRGIPQHSLEHGNGLVNGGKRIMTIVDANVWEREQCVFTAATGLLGAVRPRVLGLRLEEMNCVGFIKFRSELGTLYDVAVRQDEDLG